MRKLEEIVREYYIESLGASQLDERFPRFLQIGISGLRDLGNDLKHIVTDAVLPVNDNLTVDLPSDYIDYMVIGEVRSGKIFSLGLNDNMQPTTRDSCGDIVEGTVSNIENFTSGTSYGSTAYNKNGQFIGGRFGLGGGGNNIGTYKIYKDQGYIALNGFSGDEIALRYFANVKQVNGNFMVDEYLVEALKAWMYWKYIQRTRSYGLGEKADARAEYNREKRKAQIRTHRFNLPELLNAWKSGYRSAPRM